ncbi:MAG: winged helix-turn-helix domain-containing protein [Pseudomonadota bacterium]
MAKDTPFRLGNLTVRPQALEIETSAGASKIEHKVMGLLAAFAERPGEVWLREDLLDRLWPDDEIGDESLTRAVYQLRRALREEHGIDNLIKTVPKRGYRLEISASDRNHAGSKDRSDRPGAEAPENSIAVLPFINMSSDSEQEFFADGITEEILNVLTSVSALRVTGRTSSFSFKGQNKDLREIAALLNVAYLLEGSVRLDGNRIRITAQLIRAQDGFHDWSETFDAVVGDVFEMQEKISVAIVERISKRLEIAPLPFAPARLTHSSDAYALFLQGRQLTHRLNGADTLPRAIELLEQAIAIDPEFAQAWSWLALAHSVLPEFAPAPQWRSNFVSARTAAEHCLSLDPNTTMAWHTLGNISVRELKCDEAILSFKRAYETAPDDPETSAGLAYAYSAIGLHKEALIYVGEAIAIDPLCAVWYGILGGLEIMRGDREAAEEALRKSFDLGYGPAGFTVALLIADRAGHEDAIAFLDENFEGLGPVEKAEMKSPIVRRIIYDSFLRQSPIAKWIMGRSLAGRFKNPKIQPTISNIMGFYFLDQPQNFLRYGLSKPNPYFGYAIGRCFEQTPRGERLRSHPFFPHFAKQAGLVRAWEKYGWPECIRPFTSD